MNFIVNNIRPFLAGSLMGTFAYALHVELSPGMGKVLIRPGPNNEPVFTLNGLFNLMGEPLRNINMWKPENLDINYIFFVLTSGCLGVLTKHVIS